MANQASINNGDHIEKTAVNQKAQLAGPKKELGKIVYNKAMLEKMVQAQEFENNRNKIFRDDASSSVSSNSPVVEWIVEGSRVRAVPVVNDINVTSVNIRESSVKAPDIIGLLGFKIDLKSKIKYFKENFKKNYVLSKSHNLLVAKFAEIKVGFFVMMMSVTGVKTDEIMQMKKDAARAAISQNKKLFDENEYTEELLAIAGGRNKKQSRTQKAVVTEIRKQLTVQCDRLGLKDYFTKEKVSEIKQDQCRRILDQLMEEKMSIEYQLAMLEGGMELAEGKREIMSKHAKICGLVARTRQRLLNHMNTSAALNRITRPLSMGEGKGYRAQTA